MNHKPVHPAARENATRTTRVARWAVRQRSTAATHLLHGACYGAGTTAVGLLAVWAQQHL